MTPTTDSLIQIIYTSRAVEAFDPAHLAELLAFSRARNRAANISGMLIYDDNHFLQALEGHESVVESLVARIKADPRHTSFHIVFRRKIVAKEFGDWSMAFANTSDPEYQDLQYVRLSDLDEKLIDETSAKRMIAMFQNGLWRNAA